MIRMKRRRKRPGNNKTKHKKRKLKKTKKNQEHDEVEDKQKKTEETDRQTEKQTIRNKKSKEKKYLKVILQFIWKKKFEQKLDTQKKKIETRIRRFEQKNGIRLDDEVRFIRSWIEKPLTTGAVPSRTAATKASISVSSVRPWASTLSSTATVDSRAGEKSPRLVREGVS